jgi:hypothetical protein
MTPRHSRTIKSNVPLTTERIKSLERCGWQLQYIERLDGRVISRFARTTMIRHSRPKPPSSATQDLEPFQS